MCSERSLECADDRSLANGTAVNGLGDESNRREDEDPRTVSGESDRRGKNQCSVDVRCVQLVFGRQKISFAKEESPDGFG